MTVQPQPYEVKQIVARVFLNLGADSPSLFLLHEKNLAQRGRLIARCYRAGSLKAVWLLAAGVVQFYRRRRLVRTVNLVQERVPQAMAA